MKIKKGDTVKIISGKDKGKTGVVSKIIPSEGKILVSGINLYKKHIKPRGQKQKGEIVAVERPLYVSKVMLVCKNCNLPTRIGFKFIDNKKSRYCKKCQSLI